jgi:hypothetical protein
MPTTFAQTVVPTIILLLFFTIYGIIRDLLREDGLWNSLLNREGSIDTLKKDEIEELETT